MSSEPRASPPPENRALRLSALSFEGFRNLAAAELSPHARFTLVVGENGQGKTNLLEAIHYLLTLRPLRQAKLRELVAHGEGGASVTCALSLGEVVLRSGVSLQLRGLTAHRELRREAKAIAAEDYLVAGAVVAFTPDDLALVRGGPERRRRMLDRATFNRWPAYLGLARDYQRLLKSRNQLLRQRAAPALRESFEAQLWEVGAAVLKRRHALLGEWTPRIAEAFQHIGLVEGKLAIRYRGLADASLPELAEQLRAAAAEKLGLDQERGFTSVGPHTDDLGFALAGRSARLYASQGQVRALVLALKVAEIENLRDQLGHAPLLLLDDVSSELDPRRNASFMAYLRALPSQVVLTTTDDAALRPALAEDSARWSMAQGRVKTE